MESTGRLWRGLTCRFVVWRYRMNLLCGRDDVFVRKGSAINMILSSILKVVGADEGLRWPEYIWDQRDQGGQNWGDVARKEDQRR